MIEFIRGAWTAERITLMPAAWNNESNAAVKLASGLVAACVHGEPPPRGLAVRSRACDLTYRARQAQVSRSTPL
jgi:hypothetical protein